MARCGARAIFLWHHSGRANRTVPFANRSNAQSAARSGALCLGALKKGLSPHSFHLAADVASELMEAYQQVKRNHAVPVAKVQKNRSFSLRLNSVLFENRRFAAPCFPNIGGQTLFG